MKTPALRFFLVFPCLIASDGMSQSAEPTPGDEHWDPRFGAPGQVDVILYAIGEHNGRLYFGGEWSAVTNRTSLFEFDGEQWREVGGFMGGQGTTVRDLLSFGGELYAAGYFSSVDSVPATGLARWDGTRWRGTGLGGTALALRELDGSLYVGGVFTNAGEVAAMNVARWDGVSWHALGEGIGKEGDVVRALAVVNGEVYAGGSFTNAGLAATSRVARWSESGWRDVDGGVSSHVQGLTSYDGALYACGSFSTAGGTEVRGVARHDALGWQALGSGITGFPGTIGVLGDSVCVGGNISAAGGVSVGNFARWDGDAWSAAGEGVTAAVTRVRTIGSKMYVVGLFGAAGGLLANSVASWDGTTWHGVGNPERINGVSSSVRAFAGDGTNLYAGGLFTTTAWTKANRVARFDGMRWHALGDGLDNRVTAMTMVGGDLYVAGTFIRAGSVTALHIARWNGVEWSSLGNGIGGTVSTLAARGNDLFVGGNFSIAAMDGTASFIARWDGTNWWRVSGGPNAGFLTSLDGPGIAAIAVQGNDLILGGDFTATPDLFASARVNMTNVMRWDGANWLPMGGGVDGHVLAIAVSGQDIYIGGRFDNADGLPVGKVAHWDGDSWSDMGGGLTGSSSPSVSALAVIGGDVYVGGSFGSAGGVDARSIARWDGERWSALGQSVLFARTSGSVFALAGFGTDLYVGGFFRFAGGKSSFFLGHWNANVDYDFRPSIILSEPLYSAGMFRFRIEAAGVESYVIESAGDDAEWTSLETNDAPNYEFLDSTAVESPRRVYRVRSR